mmetsp:Transcript_89033/g.177130  ORF Transcript_89033/g.177130 Transcript_89033/m.177130 type:complete len:85 (+) Transcript_89033:2055-2309(+)
MLELSHLKQVAVTVNPIEAFRFRDMGSHCRRVLSSLITVAMHCCHGRDGCCFLFMMAASVGKVGRLCRGSETKDCAAHKAAVSI